LAVVEPLQLALTQMVRAVERVLILQFQEVALQLLLQLAVAVAERITRQTQVQQVALAAVDLLTLTARLETRVGILLLKVRLERTHSPLRKWAVAVALEQQQQVQQVALAIILILLGQVQLLVVQAVITQAAVALDEALLQTTQEAAALAAVALVEIAPLKGQAALLLLAAAAAALVWIIAEPVQQAALEL
jgi:hypothetical protein